MEERPPAIAEDLRWTRAYAIGHNQETDFLIDVKQRRYASPAIAGRTLPPDIGMRLVFADSLRRQSTVGGFRFYPSGASSGGEVAISLGSRTVHVSVNWLTGSARVAEL